MNRRLYKATLKPNYPVAEGVIIFYINAGAHQPPDIEKHAEYLASQLGFTQAKCRELTLLGKFEATKEYNLGVLHYENGEY